MDRWDERFDARCRDLAAGVVGGAGAARTAWQELLVAIAPHIEGWVGRSALLARCRMAGEDDARSVLVAVIGRLAHDDHHNLRRFLSGREAALGELPATEGQALERIGRAGAWLADAEPATDPATGTPLRAWLVHLVRFCERDHVRQRLGWSREGPSRRALGSDAARLSAVPTRGTRPPMTDLLTVRALLDRIDAAVATFPAEMAEALRLWADDTGFDAIAVSVGLPDADSARRLVRAGQARLRDRFRGDWDGMFPGS